MCQPLIVHIRMYLTESKWTCSTNTDKIMDIYCHIYLNQNMMSLIMHIHMQIYIFLHLVITYLYIETYTVHHSHLDLKIDPDPTKQLLNQKQTPDRSPPPKHFFQEDWVVKI